jgi:hypothetical protein
MSLLDGQLVAALPKGRGQRARTATPARQQRRPFRYCALLKASFTFTFTTTPKSAARLRLRPTMRDSTRDIEVWVAHVDPGAAEEDQAYAQYEEAEGVYGDNIFQTDVHVVTGEHFAIFVELGDLFDFHDNKVLKIQVSIDGGAVNICQYLDAKDHYQGPLIKKIREVRARVTDEYLQENGKETELWWCGLVFGELQARMYQGVSFTTIPANPRQFNPARFL